MYSQPPSLRSRSVCHVPTLKGSDVLPFLRILMTTTMVYLLSVCKIHRNFAYIFFLNSYLFHYRVRVEGTMSARSSPSPSFSAGIKRQNVSLKNTGLAMS